jgi:hypothetical protein
VHLQYAHCFVANLANAGIPEKSPEKKNQFEELRLLRPTAQYFKPA